MVAIALSLVGVATGIAAAALALPIDGADTDGGAVTCGHVERSAVDAFSGGRGPDDACPPGG